MPNPLLLGLGVSALGSVLGGNAQAHAADQASVAQVQAAQLGIAEQHRQFNSIRALLKPYVNAGTGALSGQKDLLGLNGADAQGGAIGAIQGSPIFGALRDQGFNAIEQNASATGGLRGGNTQAALAQFAPNMLAQLIQQQYANLGGMTQVGANAAAGQATAGSNMANNVTSLYGQQGAAQAGGFLANGNAQAGMWGGIGGAINTGLGQIMQPQSIPNPAGGTMPNPSALPGGLFQNWGF